MDFCNALYHVTRRGNGRQRIFWTDADRERLGTGAAKFMAVELACRLTGMTRRAIGADYGGITSGGVSNIRRRIRERECPLAEVTEQLSGAFSLAVNARPRLLQIIGLIPFFPWPIVTGTRMPTGTTGPWSSGRTVVTRCAARPRSIA
jgi:hypothetical protein